MEHHEFIMLYWRNYISIEKEFMSTLNYVSLDKENFKTFSPAYIKLLLQIGSEVDVAAKELCHQLKYKKDIKTIEIWRDYILGTVDGFLNTGVIVVNNESLGILKPWEQWEPDEDGKRGNPHWWKAYNRIKHNRNGKESIDGVKKECFKFANMEHIIYALAGLYQLLLYLYCEQGSDDKIKVPMPGSQIFNLTGNKWNGAKFFRDIAFHLDVTSGHLFCSEGDFSYYS